MTRLTRRTFFALLFAPLLVRFLPNPRYVYVKETRTLIDRWRPSRAQVLIIKSRQLGMTTMTLDFLQSRAGLGPDDWWRRTWVERRR